MKEQTVFFYACHVGSSLLRFALLAALVCGFASGANAQTCATPSTGRTVNLCTPGDGATVGSSVRVTAAASSGTRYLQIYLDGTKVFHVDAAQLDTSLNLSNGPHRLTVLGKDAIGTFQKAVNITVGSVGCAPPGADRTVNICTPLDGSTANSPLRVSAAARSAAGVTYLQIYLDGAKVFQVAGGQLDTTVSMNAGQHRLTVQAKDAIGTFKKSVNVTVGTLSCALPSTDRTVKICAPTDGSTVASPMRVSAAARSAAGVSYLQIYLDGAKVFQGSGAQLDAAISATAGQHRLTVLAQDSSGTFRSTIYVTVGTTVSTVTADFDGRSGATHRLQPGWLGAQYAEGLDASSMVLLEGAGIRTTRTYANLPAVFASPTPDWTKLDPKIAKLQAFGVRPIMEVAYTPVWLRPDPNPCVGGENVGPTDINKWAELAAAVVARMNQQFPGFVRDYEIWNEPDGHAFCLADNSQDNKSRTYVRLFAAAAKAMYEQAARDGVQIRVGGPALVTAPAGPLWITRLLSDSAAAPLVGFVSYHHFMGWEKDNPAGWDTDTSTTQSLYAHTQDPKRGAAAHYKLIADLVRTGLQPNPASTPIFIDEFNTNSAFQEVCCRNDPVYGPLWNALYIADVLNTVYQGAHSPPARMVYYAASRPPHFCLINCSDGQPYPQYSTFRLLGGADYLNLGNGGFMAKSVSPVSTQGGLIVTAFYSDSGNAILIVNPTRGEFLDLDVIASNLGLASPQARLHTISGGQIVTTSLSLTQSSSGMKATINVPAHTVMAISYRSSP